MFNSEADKKRAWAKKRREMCGCMACEMRDMDEEDKIAKGMAPAAIAVLIPVALAIILLLCCGIKSCHAGEIPKERAVYAIIGEAEGEPYQGKLAVACALRTRGTLRGVYGERAPRVLQHKYSPKVFVAAVRAWEESSHPENCTFIDGADHWEGTAFPLPNWAENMKVTAIIGNQKFFRYYKESEEQEQIDRRHGL